MAMRIMVLGLRGFPNVQGGIEVHSEHLYPLLREKGCKVDVIVRSPSMPAGAPREWRGVRFHPLWAPQKKYLEAIVHTFLGVVYAGVKRPDILHIHAIGPALWVPLARLLGLRVVVTHHGPDYERQKWGKGARAILKLGERCGMLFSNRCIVISRSIERLVSQKYGVAAEVIPNAVNLPAPVHTCDTLNHFGLERGRYVLMVSRIVPEKRHIDLIDAFMKSKPHDWKLAIVGASDHPDEYEKTVLARCASAPDVVSTGFQSGQSLAELYAHAGLFVLPSSHEGLPIALLEALSYGLPVIASDISANMEVGLKAEHYFPLGDTDVLSKMISRTIGKEMTLAERAEIQAWLGGKYQWKDVAQRTFDVYWHVLPRRMQLRLKPT